MSLNTYEGPVMADIHSINDHSVRTKQATSYHITLHEKRRELRDTELKFSRACQQIVFLSKMLADMSNRYNAAKKDDNRCFRYNLKLKLSVLEGVRSMFYDYVYMKAEDINKLQQEVRFWVDESSESESDSEYNTSSTHDVIPIVMGAAPEDYRRAAPHYSYIHVDEYTSPSELAEYLNELDTNDELYNEYFKWKGTGSFINTYFWCRVCAMLHDTSRGSTSYGDIEKWWRGRDVCIGKDRWGQHPQRGPYISDYYTK